MASTPGRGAAPTGARRSWTRRRGVARCASSARCSTHETTTSRPWPWHGPSHPTSARPARCMASPASLGAQRARARAPRRMLLHVVSLPMLLLPVACCRRPLAAAAAAGVRAHAAGRPRQQEGVPGSGQAQRNCGRTFFPPPSPSPPSPSASPIAPREGLLAGIAQVRSERQEKTCPKVALPVLTHPRIALRPGGPSRGRTETRYRVVHDAVGIDAIRDTGARVLGAYPPTSEQAAARVAAQAARQWEQQHTTGGDTLCCA